MGSDVITELPALAQATVGTNDDTAHYLLGKTLIAQIFVDTSDDRWTDADRQTAIGQLINAVNWLKSQSPQPSLVDFNVGKYYDVTVTKTITEAYGGFEWIDEAAASITPEDVDGDSFHTDSLVNYLRDRYHFTNTIVIYQPHMRGRSYAWRHELTQRIGSMTVVYFRPPPPSLPWQVNSEYVYVHELLHVFGACDEYVEGGKCNNGIDCGPCDNPWIDQKYDNSNCELPSCPADLPCIMRHPDTEHAICEFTRGSIGWGDVDGDGVLDPLESSSPPFLDSATFVSDVTLPNGSVVSPGQALVKTWRMQNTGSTTWSSGYQLVFVGGDQMGAPNSVAVPNITPGQTTDISVPMTAPSTPGTYMGTWRMRNPSGTFFGDEVWVLIIGVWTK